MSSAEKKEPVKKNLRPLWLAAVVFVLIFFGGLMIRNYLGIKNEITPDLGGSKKGKETQVAPPSAPVVPADSSPIYGSLMINDNPSTIKQIQVPPGWKIRFGVIGNYKYRWFVDGVPEQQFAPGMNAIVRLPGHAFKGGWQLDPGQGGSAQIVFVMFTGDESRLPAKWHEYSMRYPMN